jgi:acetylglutamate kinase
MTFNPIVVKVGGHDLSAPGFMQALADAIRERSLDQPCIVVHGGGDAIDRLLGQLAITPQFVKGLRVTDQAMVEVVEMVLSGQVNPQIVTALLAAGVDALGMSGVDRGLLKVEPWSADLGLVGRVVSVRAEVLTKLCEAGVVPVISPVSIGPGWGRYNVNADHAAGAIAAAMRSDYAAFVTNVPGVLIEGVVAPSLTSAEVTRLIDQGVIHGGMIPKVGAALEALDSGVRAVLITDLDGVCAGSGTRIVA